MHPNGTAVDAAASGPRCKDTTYWGIELRCVQSVCTSPGKIQLDQITVDASGGAGAEHHPRCRPQQPVEPGRTGHWIWNAPGNAWSLPVAGADSSGVCSLGLQVGTSAPISDPSLPPPNNSSWQECQPASWTAAVDTRDYVSGAGQMPLTLQATNAAGPPTQASMSETLNVDNDPVGVSLSTPDDPNPTVWVNHAVTVDATPSTGPSGLSAMSCEVNGAAAQSYPAGGLTVDGDGVRTVSCTAWNNAVDPQGNHNSGDQFGHGSHRRGSTDGEPGAREPQRPDRGRRRHERQRVGRGWRIGRDGSGRDRQLDEPASDVHRQPAAGPLQRRRPGRPVLVQSRPPATTSETAHQRPGRRSCQRGQPRSPGSASRRCPPWAAARRQPRPPRLRRVYEALRRV